MAHKIEDRIRDTTTSSGVGPLTVTGTAPTRYRAFSAVCAPADTIWIATVHQTANEWEVALATSDGGTGLTRTTILSSSNGGAAVSFSAGTKDVFAVHPAAEIYPFVFTDVVKGLVPASGGGSTNFLRADGTWNTPGGSSTNAFGTIVVSGQSDVVAETAPDTLTLVAGTNITITTDAGTDTITINASGGASAGGADTQIQFNDGGAFGADADFTWNKTTNALFVNGTIELGAASDTTLARVSAGVVSIEGVTILTTATGQPLDADLTSWASVTRAAGFDAFAATPSSANLDTLVTDDTGSGALVFANTPTLVSPLLGTPTSGVLTNCTGLPSIVVANEGTDTTCFIAFFTGATGELGPKTNANLTYNSNTGAFSIGTAAAFTAGTIELGAASDTTLARVSAGVVSIEGVTILTTATGQPLDADLTSWAGVTRAAGFDTFATTPSSANLITLVTDETGTGALVFANTPSLITPKIADSAGGQFYNFAVSNLTADRIVTLPLLTAGDTFVFEAHAQTLTNKTIALGSNTVSGSVAEFNAALTAADFYTTGGTDVSLADGGTGASLVDPNLDRFLFWDDSAGTIKFAILADLITEAAPAAGDFILVQRAEDDLVKVNWSSLPVGGVPTLITVANEATDTTCFPAFFTAATGDLGPKTNTNLTYNSNTGAFSIGTAAALTAGTIELGAASDTTLARSGAGDVTIEGNTVYRVGGTDVALADGGTGASLTDPNLDRVLMWDDSAATIKFADLASLTTEGAPAAGDFLLVQRAEDDIVKVNWSSLPGVGGGISNVVEDSTPELGGDLETNNFDIKFEQYSADAVDAEAIFQKSRNAAIGSHTIVQDGDDLGTLRFQGSNGTTFDTAALILAEVDATPGASADMPGRLSFWTTPDASATPLERMRISNAGGVAIGGGGAGVFGTIFTVQGNSTLPVVVDFGHWEASNVGPTQRFIKSRSASIAGVTIVNDGDTLGVMHFYGADGTSYSLGAQLGVFVDGTPGVGDMPSRFVFSTSPDGSGTPSERMRIDSAGKVVISQLGSGAITGHANTPQIQFHSSSIANNTLMLAMWEAGVNGQRLEFAKSRHTTFGSHTALNSGDTIGEIVFSGSDGVNFEKFAKIECLVESTVASNDCPGGLYFYTTPDGSATTTERLRINNAGVVIVGGAASVASVDQTGAAITPALQVLGTNASTSAMEVLRFESGNNAARLILGRSANATIGSHTAVANSEATGAIIFVGSDGTDFEPLAAIFAFTDGTVGAGDMPGSLVFATTLDGAEATTTRLTIKNDGRIVAVNGAVPHFWCYWTANSTTILASYNMTSIADTAVGDADGTIGVDFSSANWAGHVDTSDSTAAGWDTDSIQSSGFNAKAAGTFGVLCGNMIDGTTAVGGLVDPQQWSVTGLGVSA